MSRSDNFSQDPDLASLSTTRYTDLQEMGAYLILYSKVLEFRVSQSKWARFDYVNFVVQRLQRISSQIGSDISGMTSERGIRK